MKTKKPNKPTFNGSFIKEVKHPDYCNHSQKIETDETKCLESSDTNNFEDEIIKGFDLGKFSNYQLDIIRKLIKLARQKERHNFLMMIEKLYDNFDNNCEMSYSDACYNLKNDLDKLKKELNNE